jgi:hydrogenase nickel incorporation protein HypB
MMRIYLAKDLLSANKNDADSVRSILLENNMLMINLIGSPGSGKTSLLEATFKNLTQHKKVVIEGDLFTAEDAERLMPYCDKVIQINTEGDCHLLAGQISQLIIQDQLIFADLLVVENIGNLVCPADFDLGEDIRVTVISVTEGNDKPRKYPLAFKNATAVIITKTDLLPYCDFSVSRAKEDLHRINPDLKIFTLSTYNNVGMTEWIQWLTDQIKLKSGSV